MSTADLPPTTTPLVTADELLTISAKLRHEGKRCELNAGVLKIMSPSGGQHGYLASRIGRLLDTHVEAHRLGACFGAETGFLVRREPDTVKAPDAAYLRQERIETLGISEKYFPEAPTLAVEVVSPSETAKEVHEKAKMWIESGCEAVWLVWPEDRTVTDYRSLDSIRILTAEQTLDGGDVVPGFSVKVADLFVGLEG